MSSQRPRVFPAISSGASIRATTQPLPAICRFFLIVALLGAVLTIVIAVTGGLGLRVGRLRLTAHQPLVTFAVAVFGLVGVVLRPWRQSAGQVLASWWAGLDRLAPWVATTVALVTLATGIAWGSSLAAGADAYGYVSQAHLWASGSTRIVQPIALSAPWPNGDWTFAPLGYRPGRESGTIVPTYPPGLPLAMAGAIALAGPRAAFFVVPVLGAAAVWLTYVLGRMVDQPRIGMLAAIFTAASPIFVFQLLQPMSDVPVTAWWLAAVVAILQPGRYAPALAGLAGSAALLTRPNLLPLVLPLAAFLVMRAVATGHRWLGRTAVDLVLFGTGLVPGCLAVAWINSAFYGSPLSSGYGDLNDLYAFNNLLPNASRYARWMLESQTAFIFVGLIAPAVWSRGSNGTGAGRTRVVSGALLLTITGALFGCYAFYLVFGDWSFVRFLLPAVPLLLILSASVAERAIGSAPPAGRAVVLILFTAFLTSWYVRTTQQHQVLALREQNQRYEDAGRYVARKLPPHAIVLSVQQSGSVRFYSNRLTLRWDQLPPSWLDEALRILRQQNCAPYILVEAWEEPDFRRRFAAGSSIGRLDWPPVADIGRGVHVRIYDPDDRARFLAGARLLPERVFGPLHD